MREKREPPTDVVAEAADMKATKAALRKVIADPHVHAQTRMTQG